MLYLILYLGSPESIGDTSLKLVYSSNLLNTPY